MPSYDHSDRNYHTHILHRTDHESSNFASKRASSMNAWSGSIWNGQIGLAIQRVRMVSTRSGFSLRVPNELESNATSHRPRSFQTLDRRSGRDPYGNHW